MPATKNPTTEPVVRFHAIQVKPHRGVASAKNPNGNIARMPSTGPRNHHGRGHSEIPTQNPIESRAV